MILTCLTQKCYFLLSLCYVKLKLLLILTNRLPPQCSIRVLVNILMILTQVKKSLLFSKVFLVLFIQMQPNTMAIAQQTDNI